jgi:Flp pilus assembly protein CpaB
MHSTRLTLLSSLLTLTLTTSCQPPPPRAEEDVLVLRQPVAAGAALTPDLLETRRLDAALLSPAVLRPGGLPEGARAQVALPAGQPVLSTALLPDPTTDGARGQTQLSFRSYSLDMPLAEGIEAGDAVDVAVSLRDVPTGESMTMTVLQNVTVLAVQPSLAAGQRRLTLLLLPEEAEVLLLAARLGTVQPALRNPSDPGVQEERGRATMQTLLTGERINTLLKKRTTTIQIIKGTRDASSPPPSGPARYVGKSTPASGQLTAGEWDDGVNVSRLQAYLSGYQRAHAGVRVAAINDRTELKVENESGQPVPDAKVQVLSAGKVLLEGRTAADGRLLYFPWLDGAPTTATLTVHVEAAGAPEPIEATGSSTQRSWRLVVPGAKPEASTQLDVAFVLDTTGSMDDELAYLQREVDWIAREVDRTTPGVSVRFGLVVYKDRHARDPYVVRAYDFAPLELFRQRLGLQSAGGGGDYPEAMEEAVGVMNRLSWREGHVTKVAFLVADAPPHDADLGKFFDEVQVARHKGVHVYPVAASGAQDDVEFVMRQAAQLTQARYLFLTDDSGVGNAHGEPHLPCYRVQHLNALMARMIHEELSGVRVVPEPADVVRTVGHPVGGTCASE